MYVEAIAYLISAPTPLQGFFPLSTSQFYIWERGKALWGYSILPKNTMGDPR